MLHTLQRYRMARRLSGQAIDGKELVDPVRIDGAREQPRVGLDLHAHETPGLRQLVLRLAGEGIAHEVLPRRQRNAAADLAIAKWRQIVEPDPGRGNEVGVEAAEPRIALIVRRAGLAGEIRSSEI